MLFGDGIMVVFCIYYLTQGFNRICYIYRQAAGLWWQDRYRPVVESLLNLGLNIILVKYIGVVGVMFSTIFCLVTINCIWGAYTLFKHYFTDEHMSVYLLKIVLFSVLTAISGTICYFICLWLGLSGIVAIIVNLLVATFISNIVFAAGSSFLPEFKPTINFVKKTLKLGK